MKTKQHFRAFLLTLVWVVGFVFVAPMHSYAHEQESELTSKHDASLPHHCATCTAIAHVQALDDAPALQIPEKPHFVFTQSKTEVEKIEFYSSYTFSFFSLRAPPVLLQLA